MAKATFLTNGIGYSSFSEADSHKALFCYDLPFRVRFTTIGIGGGQSSMVPPIGIAIIGINNYILWYNLKMAVISIPLLKTKFETGDRPTGADYVDLIDTTSYQATSLTSIVSDLQGRVEAIELVESAVIRGTVNTNLRTTLDNWVLSNFTTVSYLLQIKQGAKIRSSNVTIITDGENIDLIEYGIMTLGGNISGLSIDASIINNPDGDRGRLTVVISDAATSNAEVVLSRTMIA